MFTIVPHSLGSVAVGAPIEVCLVSGNSPAVPAPALASRRLTLVVPCFNEASRLPVALFEQFAVLHTDYTFLFVNDGSTDHTSEVLARLHASNPVAFQVLDLGENQGKGEAVRLGLLRAIEHGSEYVGYWDADLATPLEVADDFRHILESSLHLDLIMGSRVPLLGRSVFRTAHRRLVGRMFAAAAAFVLGVEVYDTQCGAKLLRVSECTLSIVRRPFCSRWAFDIELLGRLLNGRGGPSSGQWHILEVPLPEWSDVAGSKMKPRHLVQVAWDLARIALKYRMWPAFFG